MAAVEPFEEIPVTARLAFGSERLRLVLTSNSIIVVHGGKRGAGAVVGSTLLGRLSGAIEDLFKVRKESSIRRTVESHDVLRILSADKDNFNIDYTDVVSVDVDSVGPRMASITVLTKDDKFEFFTRIDYDRILELLQNSLGSKVRTKRPRGMSPEGNRAG